MICATLCTWERLSLEVHCSAKEICGFLETSPRWQHRRPQLPLSLRDQQCDSCSWTTHLPKKKWQYCDERMWMMYEWWMMYKELYVFNVWTSGGLRWVYICETIMPIYVINISSPNDSSCPEKCYVLGNKIYQFLAFWVGGLQGHLSALLLTGCSPSLIPSLPSATITIFLSVALTYVSSVLPT